MLLGQIGTNGTFTILLFERSGYSRKVVTFAGENGRHGSSFFGKAIDRLNSAVKNLSVGQTQDGLLARCIKDDIVL
ncbi:MAG: hypothetical protein ACD_10C00827G0001 [uncultured bacterium]|nr:MAG: hypothetical protein ACD_10C00827G0001 [uncultured bacterium]